MEKDIDALADRYDQAVAVGRRFVRENWRYLSERTKDWLVASGCYSAHGSSLSPESSRESDEIERLLFDLGTLRLCVQAKLPFRGKTGETIAREALDNEVMSSAGEMLCSPRCHEPSFLRLALAAVKQHQQAWLLTRLPASRYDNAVAHVLFALFCILVLLASPAMVAFTLTEAMRANLHGAILGCYGVGLAVALAHMLRRIDKPELSSDEVAYDGWSSLHTMDGPWMGLGAGAGTKLIEMAIKGAHVPPVALDLCLALACAGLNSDRGTGKVHPEARVEKDVA